MPHYIPPKMLSERVAVALVGCGGNGSQMLTGLARLNHALIALGHPGLSVTVYDPDIVSEANIGRQMFSMADVGQSKACVHVGRINAFFGIGWDAVPTRFTSASCDILINCVDSAAARYEVAGEIKPGTRYVLDLGNRAADGQTVIGQWYPLGADPLTYNTYTRPDDHSALVNPYVMLPELVDISAVEDDTPSCGLAQALERQELFVNQAIVTPALQLLWEMFRYGKLTWCGAFVNLRTGNMRPIAV